MNLNDKTILPGKPLEPRLWSEKTGSFYPYIGNRRNHLQSQDREDEVFQAYKH